MLNKIKELADSAIKLQNKAYMEEVLREISELARETIEVNDTNNIALLVDEEKCTLLDVVDDLADKRKASTGKRKGAKDAK